MRLIGPRAPSELEWVSGEPPKTATVSENCLISVWLNEDKIETYHPQNGTWKNATGQDLDKPQFWAWLRKPLHAVRCSNADQCGEKNCPHFRMHEWTKIFCEWGACGYSENVDFEIECR